MLLDTHTLRADCCSLQQVDVEGWEWSVMQGAAGLLKGSHNIENVIMEYSPGGSESQGSAIRMSALDS